MPVYLDELLRTNEPDNIIIYQLFTCFSVFMVVCWIFLLSALEAEGREFESRRPDQLNQRLTDSGL